MKQTRTIKFLIFAFVLLTACLLASCVAGNGESETTNGMYDEYILTEEDLAELNEAYFREITSDGYYSTLDEAQLDKYRATIKFASTIEQAMYRPSERPVENDDYAHIYIGKYGECIAVAFPGSGLSMEFPSTIIKVCYNSEFYSLTTAQENGYLTDSEAEMIRDFIDTMFAEGRYDNYILTEDDLAQINEAYLQYKIADRLDDGFELSNEDIERMKNSKYSKYALTVEEAMQRNIEDNFYFGKFGDCFIFKRGPGERPASKPITYILGEYKITIQGFIRVVYNHEWIYLSEAYERGLLSDEDVDRLCDIVAEYFTDGIRYDYLSPQTAYVDYSDVTPEFIKEINAAWLKQSGYDVELLTDLDSLMYGTGRGEKYLGKYNDYYVFYFNDSRNIHTSLGTYNVANHSFYEKGKLAAYKNGIFYELTDLYARGEISYVDVSKMHDKHLEIIGMTDRDTIEEYGYVAIPRVNKLELDQITEQTITKTLAKYLSSEQKVYITDYYGNYNGAHVFKYKSPSIRYYIGSWYYEEVANKIFLYRYDTSPDNVYKGNRLFVYYKDAVYTLSEAYDKGFLNDEDIVMIRAYHQNYYPYAIDNLVHNGGTRVIVQKLD